VSPQETGADLALPDVKRTAAGQRPGSSGGKAAKRREKRGAPKGLSRVGLEEVSVLGKGLGRGLAEETEKARCWAGDTRDAFRRAHGRSTKVKASSKGA